LRHGDGILGPDALYRVYLVGRYELHLHFFLDGDEPAEYFATRLERERTRDQSAFTDEIEGAVATCGHAHRTVLANGLQPITEFEQWLQIAIARLDEGFGALVLLHHRAGPAAEARRGRAARWSLGL